MSVFYFNESLTFLGLNWEKNGGRNISMLWIVFSDWLFIVIFFFKKREHTGPVPSECTTCGTEFESKSKLHAHLKGKNKKIKKK